MIRITRELDEQAVLEGYREGIFPMGYEGRNLFTWHCPHVRAVLPLDALHVSRSLERTLRRPNFTITCNQAFAAVVQGCAERRTTWITPEIQRVYQQLHLKGHAHSLEVWQGEQLAGGIYGVQIGGAFFAESKFHRVKDMSKVALVHLVWRLREQGFRLLEVQYRTEHLAQFGVIEISHSAYLLLLRDALGIECRFA